MDMKNRTLEGGDSYHSHRAGIKGGQSVRSELVFFQETDIF
jgi:hypothetical protein